MNAKQKYVELLKGHIMKREDSFKKAKTVLESNLAEAVARSDAELIEMSARGDCLFSNRSVTTV